jgi:hypothetical protein
MITWSPRSAADEQQSIICLGIRCGDHVGLEGHAELGQHIRRAAHHRPVRSLPMTTPTSGPPLVVITAPRCRG